LINVAKNIRAQQCYRSNLLSTLCIIPNQSTCVSERGSGTLQWSGLFWTKCSTWPTVLWISLIINSTHTMHCGQSTPPNYRGEPEQTKLPDPLSERPGVACETTKNGYHGTMVNDALNQVLTFLPTQCIHCNTQSQPPSAYINSSLGSGQVGSSRVRLGVHAWQRM
jgi:hypothetical protein